MFLVTLDFCVPECRRHCDFFFFWYLCVVILDVRVKDRLGTDVDFRMLKLNHDPGRGIEREG